MDEQLGLLGRTSAPRFLIGYANDYGRKYANEPFLDRRAPLNVVGVHRFDVMSDERKLNAAFDCVLFL